MDTLNLQTPPSNVLANGLSQALSSSGREGEVAILHREPHSNISTYPSEVVTCRTSEHGVLKLLVKYSAGRDHLCFGHRGGISYEAEVYRSVLGPTEQTAPRFFGTHDDPATGWTWLVMEFLENSLRMNKSLDGPRKAADWLGRFHAANENFQSKTTLTFLKRYDDAYYRGWKDRVREFSLEHVEEFTGLSGLLEAADEIFDSLQSARPTIIHGEFYGANILLRDGLIYPVDWESAAVAAGEIDLASLTQAWDEATVSSCEKAYALARWPEGAPLDFAKTLQAARIYFLFRWLGETRQGTSLEKRLKRYRQEFRSQVHRWD